MLCYEIITLVLGLAQQAIRDFKRLSANHRAAVRDAIEKHLRQQPTRPSKSRIKRLRELEQPQYRLRVGEIRIFYDVTDDSVQILAIVPKSEAQKWLEEEGECS